VPPREISARDRAAEAEGASAGDGPVVRPDMGLEVEESPCRERRTASLLNRGTRRGRVD